MRLYDLTHIYQTKQTHTNNNQKQTQAVKTPESGAQDACPAAPRPFTALRRRPVLLSLSALPFTPCSHAHVDGPSGLGASVVKKK